MPNRNTAFFAAALLALSTFALLGSNRIGERIGPFYANGYHDASYAYLMAAQQVRVGKYTTYRDHPGTSVQAIGALAARFSHPFSSNPEVTRFVFADPEGAIRANANTLLVIGLMLTALGAYLVARAFASEFLGLVFFTLPFLSPHVWNYSRHYMPDYFVVALGMLICALGLSSIRRRTQALGIVFGIMLATKITGLSLGIIPFALLRRNKTEILRFAKFLVPAALIAGFPLLWDIKRSAGHLLIKVPALIFRSNGGHVLPPAQLLKNIWGLAISSPLPLLGLASGLFLVILLRTDREGRAENKARRELAYAAMIGICAQLFMSATDNSPRYVMPAHAFSSMLCVWLLHEAQGRSRFLREKMRLSALAFCLILVGAAIAYIKAPAQLQLPSIQMGEPAADIIIAPKIAELHCRIVYGSPEQTLSDNPFSALDWGHNFAGRGLTVELQAQFPDVLFYNSLRDRIETFAGQSPNSPAPGRAELCLVSGMDYEVPAVGPKIFETANGTKLYRFTPGVPEATSPGQAANPDGRQK